MGRTYIMDRETIDIYEIFIKYHGKRPLLRIWGR
jgi:hypothetical protein